MHVVFAASEAAPFSKSGGLGDVAGSLPRHLARHCSVTLMIPDYAAPAGTRPPAARETGRAEITLGGESFPVTFTSLRESPRFQVVWVGQELMFARRFLYGDGSREYPDNFHRFLAFQAGVAAWCRAAAGRVDLVHANDWQTALLPLLLRRNPPRRRLPATVLTIHNLGYQGVFDGCLFPLLDLPGEYFTLETLEFFGRINCLKGGVVFADAVTTVSPTYAREILQPGFGCGLEGVLRRYRRKLTGILNGADTDAWNPRRDSHLTQTYGVGDAPAAKAANRAALMRELGLDWPPDRPLAVAVTRLTRQKGTDILIRALSRKAPGTVRAVILGTGESRLEARLHRLAGRNPGVHFIPRFSEPLAHRLQAAGDLFLMPSLYEPCGLAQMYAMRYGTLPVVRRTGGLADTVRDADGTGEGTGFVFTDPKAAALGAALDRGARAWADRDRWRRLQAHAMSGDFSWERSAALYADLYRRTLTTGDQNESIGNR